MDRKVKDTFDPGQFRGISPSQDMDNFAASFRVVAQRAARDSGMVGGVMDENGKLYLTPFIAGVVIGHQGAIEQGLLPANPLAAFSVFIDSQGKSIGVHWKSAYNSAEGDFVPPASIRQQIIDSIPEKSPDFFESGLD